MTLTIIVALYCTLVHSRNLGTFENIFGQRFLNNRAIFGHPVKRSLRCGTQCGSVVHGEHHTSSFSYRSGYKIALISGFAEEKPGREQVNYYYNAIFSYLHAGRPI